MAEVIYLTRKKLYPRFGFALPEKQIAHVRDDLPVCVKQFVISHEVYHLTDNTNGWAWREIRANMHSEICVILLAQQLKGSFPAKGIGIFDRPPRSGEPESRNLTY